MDWKSIFSQRTPRPGALASEIERLVNSIFMPLSAAEISDVHAQSERIDPTKWQFPNAELPASFLEFLQFSNGGDFGNGDRWFQFFSALDAKHGLRAMLLAYEFPQYMPLALPFAFNGGGTFYAFDFRREAIDGEYPVVASHASCLGWNSDDHWFVAPTFRQACAGTTNIDSREGDV